MRRLSELQKGFDGGPLRSMHVIGGNKLKQLQPEYQLTFCVTRSQDTRIMPLSGA